VKEKEGKKVEKGRRGEGGNVEDNEGGEVKEGEGRRWISGRGGGKKVEKWKITRL
jgi:hypothetical protein